MSSILRTGLAGLVFIGLGSCGDEMVSRNSFESQYAVARNALEGGQYDRARRSYQKLLQQAGPLAPRMQLEYAHTELRAGNYEQAAQIAASLAGSQKGLARSAALAVQGTAQHELGLKQLSEGNTAAGQQNLTAANAALQEVLKSNPDLDPLGAMAGRQAKISSRLKRL